MEKISAVVFNYTESIVDTYYLADKYIYDKENQYKESFRDWIETEISTKLRNNNNLKDEGITVRVYPY